MVRDNKRYGSARKWISVLAFEVILLFLFSLYIIVDFLLFLVLFLIDGAMR